MAQTRNDQLQETLLMIPQGTAVYDADNHKVGKVKDVQLSAQSGEAPNLSGSFYNLPNELQIHLMRAGFIQIDCGLFARDRFITPNQIETIRDDGLKLNVTSSELIKG
jgi:hypothetical protein